MKTYLGIDNGVTGALAWINGLGSLIQWWPIPIQKARKGNEIDVLSLKRLIQDASINPADTMVVIEEPGGSKSARAATSMAGSFHALRATFVLLGFPVSRITPQEWQKAILRCAPGDTKKVAETTARQLWPEEQWLATGKCCKPHEGGVDAALIAHYAKTKNL